MKLFSRFNPFFIVLSAIIIGIAAYLLGVPFLDLMELKTIDLRFLTRGEIFPSQDIVLAVVDEKSIAKEGKWVWPRSKFVDLVNKLSDAGAKVIAFDVGFLESDENDKRIYQTLEQFKTEIHQQYSETTMIDSIIDRLKKKMDTDNLLANAIKNSRAKVILGYFFQISAEHAKHLSEQDISLHQENIKSGRYKLVQFTSDKAKKAPFLEASAPQSNIKPISDSADYSGYFNMYPDRDGVVRWMPAIYKFKDSLYAPLSVIAASVFMDVSPSVKVADYGVESISIGNIPIPVDEYGRILINYRGKEKTFPHISITDILQGKVSPDRLKNKIVFVGATAIGIYDMRVTPYGDIFPGLEIHANIADNILKQDCLHQPGWSIVIDIAAIFIAGFFPGIILLRTGAIAGALTSGALFIGHILLCQYLFSRHGLILNIVYPLSVLLAVVVSMTVYRYLTEAKQKRFIREAFSHYLSKSVVEKLIENPKLLVLGGEERMITAFFSDIKGFTSIAEKLSPKELVELLNEFLTEMANIILIHEGTIDKFIGDAIVAFFGAPNILDNHAKVACMACIDMQKKLDQIRSIWKSKNKPELNMRIGISTGYAVIGNMGTKQRMNYTMMGDTVNIAARLEGVNKAYGTYSLVSESTFKLAGDGIIAREIDSIYVVGKKEPLIIYELIGYPQDIDERRMQSLEYYARGLQAYRNREWTKAIAEFNTGLEIAPYDGPSRTMAARCQQYENSPPPKDWNGSFILEIK